MSRSARLLALLQTLRNHRFPVAAAKLAEHFDVSVRTIYRDIDSLRDQGADIHGDAGTGYTLKEGFVLPPLMFSMEEIEALVMGSRWVKRFGDQLLVDAAQQALAKIEAVLPAEKAASIERNTLFVSSSVCSEPAPTHIAALLREAIREEYKIKINYADAEKKYTQRVIYPFALAFFDSLQLVAAWCELRQDFRNFRVDRIIDAKLMEEHYPESKTALYQRWLKVKKIGK